RNANLVQNVLDVFLDGFEADIQRLGNLLVGLAQGQQPQHFGLTLGERDFDVGQTRGGQGTAHTADFAAGPGRFAGGSAGDGLQNVVALAALEQIAAGA